MLQFQVLTKGFDKTEGVKVFSKIDLNTFFVKLEWNCNILKGLLSEGIIVNWSIL